MDGAKRLRKKKLKYYDLYSYIKYLKTEKWVYNYCDHPKLHKLNEKIESEKLIEKGIFVNCLPPKFVADELNSYIFNFDLFNLEYVAIFALFKIGEYSKYYSRNGGVKRDDKWKMTHPIGFYKGIWDVLSNWLFGDQGPRSQMEKMLDRPICRNLLNNCQKQISQTIENFMKGDYENSNPHNFMPDFFPRPTTMDDMLFQNLHLDSDELSIEEIAFYALDRAMTLRANVQLKEEANEGHMTVAVQSEINHDKAEIWVLEFFFYQIMGPNLTFNASITRETFKPNLDESIDFSTYFEF